MPTSTVSEPSIRAQYLEEPLLEFADGRTHIDPKAGISRFGPKSLSAGADHPRQVEVGFIGTAETIATTRTWLEQSAQGVPGDEKHLEFPGFQSDRGFLSQIVYDDGWIAQISQSELESILAPRKKRDRFDLAIGALDQKLGILARKDHLPRYVIVALPDELYRKCRVVNYVERGLGVVHRDLRRAFKAVAMRYRLPTQLVRMQTVDGRVRDNPAKIAWNFFTGMYFKAGGVPWGPTSLTPGTCYVGISFYRALGTANPTVHTSLIQAFDEHGDGLVLRGPEFNWNADAEGTPSPHLTETAAGELIRHVLARYKEELHQTPKRVVVHKSSNYWPAERAGFKEALRKQVQQFDLVSLTRQSRARLLPASKYPPLRGTRFSVGDVDYLYTMGFIAELGEFHSLHVPSPIQITDHIGQDTPREVLLREILVLTKTNWNSARFGGSMPITLRFSDLVGEIMREIPSDRDPLPQFKFYM